MVKMHIPLQPQEVEVFYILPAIRRELAVALKEQGRSQKQIAQILGVTEGAVSQYISQKRGNDVVFPAALAKKVKDAAPRIKDKTTLIQEIQIILKEAKDAKLTCKLHEQMAHGIPKGCNVCFPDEQ